jgi:hypothetical protein
VGDLNNFFSDVITHSVIMAKEVYELHLSYLNEEFFCPPDLQVSI